MTFGEYFYQSWGFDVMKEKTGRNRDKPNEANKEYEDHLTAIYPLFHSNFDWKIMLRIFFKK